MVRILSFVLCVFFVSSCDTPTPNYNETSLGAANTIIGGGSSEPESTALSSSQILGSIVLLNGASSANDITITVRNSNISSLMQPSGDFNIELPKSDTPRKVILDISGSNVISSSISVEIPALVDLVTVDAPITGRSPPISFNLDTGSTLQNPQSKSRTSVSVPANAFEFLDGTNATGIAEVSITEIDIQTSVGESSWAPNLIGIASGMNEPTALISFGMSDFHFSQNGHPLQLKPDVNATLKMDLITPYLTTGESVIAVDATEGSVIPLWHYDTADMTWKEEGSATVILDEASTTGFSAVGEVSHFSTWNIDKATPSMEACVVVVLVDSNGRPRDDLKLMSYTTTASIPKEDGPGWHMDQTSWSNTVHMTPNKNKITVLSNAANRQSLINRYPSVTGFTTMSIEVDNVVVENFGRIDISPVRSKKIFHSYNGDDTIIMEVMVGNVGNQIEILYENTAGLSGSSNTGTDTFSGTGSDNADQGIELVVEPVPTVSASVEVVIVDFFGDIRDDLTVESYRVTATTNATEWASQKELDPVENQMHVQANDQDRINSGAIITTQVLIDELVIAELGDVDMLFTVSGRKIFNTFDDDHKIVLTVAIADERDSSPANINER